jgi:hypothetical protein
MIPSASWFAALVPAEHASGRVEAKVAEGQLPAAVGTWCELAQWLGALENDLGLPACEAPEHEPYAGVVRATAAAGRTVASALAELLTAQRESLFSRTPYLREENFQAHLEGIETEEHALCPMEPQTRTRIETGLGMPPTEPEDGEAWKDDNPAP